MKGSICLYSIYVYLYHEKLWQLTPPAALSLVKQVPSYINEILFYICTWLIVSSRRSLYVRFFNYSASNSAQLCTCMIFTYVTIDATKYHTHAVASLHMPLTILQFFSCTAPSMYMYVLAFHRSCAIVLLSSPPTAHLCFFVVRRLHQQCNGLGPISKPVNLSLLVGFI